MMGKHKDTKSEYFTASVIRDTEEFVKTHKRWPQSWADLKYEQSESQQFVKFNFQLDVATCDGFDIATAISPKNGSFYTYPHAEDDLRQLYKRILEIRKK